MGCCGTQTTEECAYDDGFGTTSLPAVWATAPSVAAEQGPGLRERRPDLLLPRMCRGHRVHLHVRRPGEVDPRALELTLRSTRRVSGSLNFVQCPRSFLGLSRMATE